MQLKPLFPCAGFLRLALCQSQRSVGYGAAAQLSALLEKLEAAGMKTVDYSDNDVVKMHIRHLVRPQLAAPQALAVVVWPASLCAAAPDPFHTKPVALCRLTSPALVISLS